MGLSTYKKIGYHYQKRQGIRKYVSSVCEQQRHRSACAIAQADLRLCYSGFFFKKSITAIRAVLKKSRF